MSRIIDGGAAMIAPLVGQTKALLLREVSRKGIVYLKSGAEHFEPGEKPLDALVRLVDQEYGIKDLLVERDADGHVVKIVDPRILEYRELMEPQQVLQAATTKYPEPREFTRHVWIVVVDDSLIDALSGKRHERPQENEVIETHAFNRRTVPRHKYLPDQRFVLQYIEAPKPRPPKAA